MKYGWLFLLCFSSFGLSSNLYPFTSPQNRHQFYQLTSQLRCLICLNKNGAASNAPFAQNIRGQIYARIQAGQSSKTIIGDLTMKYKNYISFKPLSHMGAYLFWLFISISLLLSIFLLLKYTNTLPKISPEKFWPKPKNKRLPELLEDELDP